MNEKPQENKGWEERWKEFYGLYGDIGRSEEDIKSFISAEFSSLQSELEKMVGEEHGLITPSGKGLNIIDTNNNEYLTKEKVLEIIKEVFKNKGFDNTFGTIIVYCDEKGCKTEEQFEGFDGHCDLETTLKEAKENGRNPYDTSQIIVGMGCIDCGKKLSKGYLIPKEKLEEFELTVIKGK